MILGMAISNFLAFIFVNFTLLPIVAFHISARGGLGVADSPNMPGEEPHIVLLPWKYRSLMVIRISGLPRGSALFGRVAGGINLNSHLFARVVANANENASIPLMLAFPTESSKITMYCTLIEYLRGSKNQN